MSLLGNIVSSITGSPQAPQTPAPAASVATTGAAVAPATTGTPAAAAAAGTVTTRDVILDIRPGDSLADQLPVIAKAAADPRVDQEIAARLYEIQQKWNEAWQKTISSLTG